MVCWTQLVAKCPAMPLEPAGVVCIRYRAAPAFPPEGPAALLPALVPQHLVLECYTFLSQVLQSLSIFCVTLETNEGFPSQIKIPLLLHFFSPLRK